MTLLGGLRGGEQEPRPAACSAGFLLSGPTTRRKGQWAPPKTRVLALLQAVTCLPLGFPMACCLLAFSMACFLCSWVMEKPGRGPQMRHPLPGENATAFPSPLLMVLSFWHQNNLCVPEGPAGHRVSPTCPTNWLCPPRQRRCSEELLWGPPLPSSMTQPDPLVATVLSWHSRGGFWPDQGLTWSLPTVMAGGPRTGGECSGQMPCSCGVGGGFWRPGSTSTLTEQRPCPLEGVHVSQGSDPQACRPTARVETKTCPRASPNPEVFPV